MRTVRTRVYTPSDPPDFAGIPVRAAWHELWYQASRRARVPKGAPSEFLYHF
jgi:hypothetical protein